MKMLPRQNKRKLSCNMNSNQNNDNRNGPSSSQMKPHTLPGQISISPSLRHFTTDNWKADYVKKEDIRLESGHHEPCIINVMKLYNCDSKNKVEELPHSEKTITPTVIELQLSQSHTNAFLQRHIQCLYMSRKKRPAKMSRGTQTLYRESSMQTLPYLPDVSNDKETLKTLELFKLPKLLNADGPPGLFEVQILERARKRWAFEKSIKEKFQCAMKTARTDAARKKLIPQHKAILEAFEWEHWLQREELIQGCQMMRFQLILGIFEKREREMHKKSTIRLQKSCEDIIKKRDQALMKNDIEFGRKMRRLKIEHGQKSRNWRKEKISDQLGDPSSEFYAPQMRYGVNPNRRHFQLSRKAFEMRMDDLGKRAVNMKNLECPFAKLKEWSKPKVQVPEVEPNFCTETNLQKLYEGLKNLREQSKKQKIVPKCLVEKLKKPTVDEMISEDLVIEELDIEQEEESNMETDEEAVQVGSSYSRSSLLEMNSQRNNQNLTIRELLDERRREELESMISEYEGSQIGWLMRFLSEEMCRLQEQRKLHFVTMLAQKERWRREAAEAGLRQKENEMRKIYEGIFDETHQANREVCEQYLDNIFGIDTQEQADYEAVANVTELARVIDSDLTRWVSSFQPIQNPLNYDSLRCLLRDLVFPDSIAECLCQQYEMQSVVDYVINDVLLNRVYELLEPFDISSSLANDLIDRLIDNDLYIFSSECSSCCDCQGICVCRPPKLEAKAILRKLIRYSVPGCRWRTRSERIADESLKEIVDTACSSVSVLESRYRKFSKNPSRIDLLESFYDNYEAVLSDTSTDNTFTDTVTVTDYYKVHSNEGKMGSLKKRENILWDDTSKSLSSLEEVNDLSAIDTRIGTIGPISLKDGASYFDITIPVEFNELYSSQTTSYDEVRSTRTDLYPTIQQATESFLNEIINNVINDNELVPPSESATFVKETSKDSEIKLDATEQSELLPTEKQIGSSSFDIELSDATELSESSTKKDIYSVIVHEDAITYDAKGYEMVMYEGELEKILCDTDECMCQMEIEYRNHIRELFESGKIMIIHKHQQPTAETETDQNEKDINVADLVFEYVTSVDEEIEDFNGPLDEEEIPYAAEESKIEDNKSDIELAAETVQETGDAAIVEEIALEHNVEQPTANEIELNTTEPPMETVPEEIALEPNVEQPTANEIELNTAEPPMETVPEDIEQNAPPNKDTEQAEEKEQENVEQASPQINEEDPQENADQSAQPEAE